MQFRINTGQGRSPWWSPDGATIAFESNRDDPAGVNYAIYTMSGPTWVPAQISGSNVCGQHPKWSPDGTQIVCAMAAAGSTTCGERFCIALIDGLSS